MPGFPAPQIPGVLNQTIRSWTKGCTKNAKVEARPIKGIGKEKKANPLSITRVAPRM